jgi:hypothetical protein
MARTFQTARLSTGATAKRVSFRKSAMVPLEALADVDMQALPSLDLQVSTCHVIENL